MAGYGTDQGFVEWTESQGLQIPIDSPSLSVLRQIGSDYVDAAYSHKLQCSTKTGGYDQERAWPRSWHRVNGRTLPDDLIPLEWIRASYRAAYLHASTPGWATGTRDPGRITKREQVDTISREFFGPGESVETKAAPGVVVDAIIDGLVSPFLCGGSRSFDDLFRVI